MLTLIAAAGRTWSLDLHDRIATATARLAPREKIAVGALLIVLALTLLNLLFNLVAIAAGRHFPYSSFLFRSDDNFGDFFSMLQGYPGGGAARIADRAGLHALLPLHPPSSDPLPGGRPPIVTIFHMPPVSTLAALATLRVMRLVDPVALFLMLLGGLVAYWCAIATRFARTRGEALAWIALGLFSYPSLMMFVRGNLFAGLAALLLVHALLLALRRRAPVAAAIMLAVAVNIRPNAILFAAPLLAFHWNARWRIVATLAAIGPAIAGASLVAATALFPAYTLASFLAGLRAYYFLYVIQSWGVAYGSSLYGALKLFVGYRHGLDLAATLVSLGIVLAGVGCHLARRIDDATLLFVVAAGYALGSTVLGDYHLMLFLLIPMAIALAQDGAGAARERRGHRIALLAACLILAPKNYYFFVETVSAQVLLNPLLLLRGSLRILVAAVGGRRGEPATPPERLATA